MVARKTIYDFTCKHQIVDYDVFPHDISLSVSRAIRGELDVDCMCEITLCYMGLYVENELKNFDGAYLFYKCAYDIGETGYGAIALGDWYREHIRLELKQKYSQEYHNWINVKIKKFYVEAIILGNFHAHRKLGTFYYGQDEYKNALKCYMVSYNSGCKYVACRLGVLFDAMGKTQKAEKYFLESVRNFETKQTHMNWTLYYTGQHYYNRDNETLAVKYFQMAHDCKNYEASFYLGIVLYKKMNMVALKADKNPSNNDCNVIKMRDYFLEAEAIGDDVATYLGQIYRSCYKNFDKAKEYFLLDIENEDDANAMNELGNMYFDYGEYDEAKKYYLMGIEHGNKYCYKNYGRAMIIQNNKINAIPYLLYAHENDMFKATKLLIECTDRTKMNELALSMCKKIQTKRNIQLAKDYVLQGKFDEAYEIAKTFNEDNNNESATICLLELAKVNHHPSLNLLGKLEKDMNLAKQWFIKAIEYGNTHAFNELQKITKSKLELFISLSRITNNLTHIESEMNTLRSNKHVMRFINRKKWSENGECPTCYCECVLVPLACTHLLCEECHVKVDICPQCRDVVEKE